MSDYPNPNINRSDGLTARGLFVILGIVLFVFVLLAALGAGTRDGTTALPVDPVQPVQPANTVPLTD